MRTGLVVLQAVPKVGSGKTPAKWLRLVSCYSPAAVHQSCIHSRHPPPPTHTHDFFPIHDPSFPPYTTPSTPRPPHPHTISSPFMTPPSLHHTLYSSPLMPRPLRTPLLFQDKRMPARIISLPGDRSIKIHLQQKDGDRIVSHSSSSGCSRPSAILHTTGLLLAGPATAHPSHHTGHSWSGFRVLGFSVLHLHSWSGFRVLEFAVLHLHSWSGIRALGLALSSVLHLESSRVYGLQAGRAMGNGEIMFTGFGGF